MSKLDMHESGWIMTELMQKYPGLDEKLRQAAVYAQQMQATQPYVGTPYPTQQGYTYTPQPGQPTGQPYVPQNPYQTGGSAQAPHAPYPMQQPGNAQGQNPPVQNPYQNQPRQ